MSVETHLQAVADKRATIKTQIAEEMQRPMPNFALIHDLKKQNLKLKEEMQSCFERLHAEAS
jgi:hypothetical protein